MIVKRYTYTQWMKGKVFVLLALDDYEEKRVSSLIRSSGGIVKPNKDSTTDYVIYRSMFAELFAQSSSKGKKKISVSMSLDEFDKMVNDKEKGKEENVEIGSVILMLQGDHTSCFVQELKVVYSALPLKDAQLIFEIYNAAHGEYAMAAKDDFDTSYSGLYGLDDEIVAARKKLKSDRALKEKYKTGSDFSFSDVLSSNPERYKSVKKYFENGKNDEKSIDFCILPVMTEKHYWIDLCQVTSDVYYKYADGLNHVYEVAELFDPEDMPLDFDDPTTVSIFGTDKFKAFADLSYGC